MSIALLLCLSLTFSLSHKQKGVWLPGGKFSGFKCWLGGWKLHFIPLYFTHSFTLFYLSILLHYFILPTLLLYFILRILLLYFILPILLLYFILPILLLYFLSYPFFYFILFYPFFYFILSYPFFYFILSYPFSFLLYFILPTLLLYFILPILLLYFILPILLHYFILSTRPACTLNRRGWDCTAWSDSLCANVCLWAEVGWLDYSLPCVCQSVTVLYVWHCVLCTITIFV